MFFQRIFDSNQWVFAYGVLAAYLLSFFDVIGVHMSFFDYFGYDCKGGIFIEATFTGDFDRIDPLFVFIVGDRIFDDFHAPLKVVNVNWDEAIRWENNQLHWGRHDRREVRGRGKNRRVFLSTSDHRYDFLLLYDICNYQGRQPCLGSL